MEINGYCFHKKKKKKTSSKVEGNTIGSRPEAPAGESRCRAS